MLEILDLSFRVDSGAAVPVGADIPRTTAGTFLDGELEVWVGEGGFRRPGDALQA